MLEVTVTKIKNKFNEKATEVESVIQEIRNLRDSYAGRNLDRIDSCLVQQTLRGLYSDIKYYEDKLKEIAEHEKFFIEIVKELEAEEVNK